MSKFITVNIAKHGEYEFSILVKDALDQMSDEDLLNEIQNRGLYLKAYTSNMISYYHPENEMIYRELCDIAEVNYHTDKDTLIELIKNKIK